VQFLCPRARASASFHIPAGQIQSAYRAARFAGRSGRKLWSVLRRLVRPLLARQAAGR
jgi:hypothetical protein